jgi:hypothetical protein
MNILTKGELTKAEVAEWIRDLIPYLEKPAIISTSGTFEKDYYDVEPGKIISYGDCLTPSNLMVMLHQTENLKILKDLYIALEK